MKLEAGMKEKLNEVCTELVRLREDYVSKYVNVLVANKVVTQHANDYLKIIRDLDIHVKALVSLGAKPSSVPNYIV